MTTKFRIADVLLAALLLSGLGACTTQEATPGGGGNGGSVGGGTGGSTTIPIGGNGTLCPSPQQVITDFTYDPAAVGASTTEVRFACLGNGGESYYPNAGNYPMTVDVTGHNYHISGTVGDYSGFGLYFDSCDRIDASGYQGIRFTVSGSVPQGNKITFGVGTVNNTPTWSWYLQNGKTTAKETDVGRCTPSSNTNNQYYHPGCEDPTTQIPVTATPVVQSVLWASLTGGTPAATVTPSELTSIYWRLPWTENGTPYQVDLVLDDLEFIP